MLLLDIHTATITKINDTIILLIYVRFGFLRNHKNRVLTLLVDNFFAFTKSDYPIL